MWPDWIEELKSRYLNNEASVFLLHGAVDAGRWVVEGQTVDCMTTLVQFLTRSREILGVLDPKRGLSFPGVGDRARFQHLVEARRTLDGDITSLREDKPEECLALLHKALSTSGPAQGYVLVYAEALFPEKKRPVPSLPAKVPSFTEWLQDPVLRNSDNLVVLLTEDLEKIHRDIRARLGRGLIEVPDEHPPVEVTHEVTADVDLGGLMPTPGLPEDSGDDITPLSAMVPPIPETSTALPTDETFSPSEMGSASVDALADELADLLTDAPADEPVDDPPTVEAPIPPAPEGYTPTLDAAPTADTPPPPPPPEAADADDLRTALEAALRRAPSPPWPGLLPMREALAQVIHARAPGRCGPLLFSLSEDGQVIAEGPGDEWFEKWFGGIVVRAASEQILNKLVETLGGAPVPPEGALPLEEPKLRALRKQIGKALAG